MSVWGRWDFFGVAWACLLGPCLCSCITLCFCHKKNGQENGRYYRPDDDEFVDKQTKDRTSRELMMMCVACMAPIATAVLWLWGVISIANKSLLCGDGCSLQD